MSINTALYNLDRKLASRPRNDPPGIKTAAVNLMPLVDEVVDLIDATRKGIARPDRVPESIYPGGKLPPGDVVPVRHYTTAPEGTQALDPAMYGSRPTSRSNKEYNRVTGPAFADSAQTQFYIPGQSLEEPDITSGRRVVEGALPGMYNITDDPDGIKAYLEENFRRRMDDYGFIGAKPTRTDPSTYSQELDREIRRRGYTGGYRTPDDPTLSNVHQGPVAYSLTPVDLEGNAPNIAAMREQLGLPVRQGGREQLLARGGPYAQVTTESMPGAEFFASRYKGYSDNPAAGAMLHADMEQLLRDPDGGSVVARMLGVQDAPVRQSQGVYKGQRNPVAAARLRIEPPEVDPSWDAEWIAEHAVLSPQDRAQLDATAIVEGVLRDQDAAAWVYPVVSVPESEVATRGIPWGAVNMAQFRSSMINAPEVAEIADTLGKLDPPEGMPDWTDSLEDVIAVTEPPDGAGGVVLTNVGDLPPQDFQQVVRDLRSRFSRWESSRNMTTEWGRADTGFHEYDNYPKAIQQLPAELQERVVQTIDALKPHADRIKGYHDSLRNVPEQAPQQFTLPTPTAETEPLEWTGESN